MFSEVQFADVSIIRCDLSICRQEGANEFLHRGCKMGMIGDAEGQLGAHFYSLEVGYVSTFPQTVCR